MKNLIFILTLLALACGSNEKPNIEPELIIANKTCCKCMSDNSYNHLPCMMSTYNRCVELFNFNESVTGFDECWYNICYEECLELTNSND